MGNFLIILMLHGVTFMVKSTQKLPILLVDDNPHDYEATKRCFEQLNITNPLMYCADGEEAIELLQSHTLQSQSISQLLPCLILLDLNLPGTDGRDLLEQLKRHESLKSIPVVILTTSSDPEDIEACYYKGANSYMVKPVDYDGLMDVIKRLSAFWFEVAQIPAMA